MKMLKKIAIGCIVASLPAISMAEVRLPEFFTDSMVIQHDAVLTIPGYAKKGATVKVTPSWSGATVKAKADKRGHFKVQLPTPAVGGPYEITFDDGKRKTLKDVWTGEVWFCSGQSNMEMPVQGWGKVMDYRKEVADADYPMIRLLQVQKQTAYSEQEDTKVNMGGWRTATPQTVADFSAIGYFFGRDLNDNLGVPIGIIDCTWGGTPIEAWMDYGMLRHLDEFPTELGAIEACDFDETKLVFEYNQRKDQWLEKVMPTDNPFDVAKMQEGWQTMPVPALWEGTVLPKFDGVVWMQCAFNATAADAGKPATLSLAMIDDQDVTYVNGVKVGSDNKYNADRIYQIPEGVIQAGANVITIRVTDTAGSGGIWGAADNLFVDLPSGKVSLDGQWPYLVTADFAENPMPKSPISSSYPTLLHNAMMRPLTVMPVKGVLWYQGCANVGRDRQYAKLFKAMIENWRDEWNQPDMPFYFVQLAGYLQPKRFQPDSQWAALRDAQKEAKELDNVEMAVAIDLGNPDDIHPKNKQEVARRLSSIALVNLYGKQIPWRAPEVKTAQVDGRYATLTFDGDVTLYGGGQGFIVKDKDGHWAQGYGRQKSARVIEVSSDEVANPVEIRYDWADYPDGELRGLSGLPVPPFKLNVK